MSLYWLPVRTSLYPGVDSDVELRRAISKRVRPSECIRVELDTPYDTPLVSRQESNNTSSIQRRVAAIIQRDPQGSTPNRVFAVED